MCFGCFVARLCRELWTWTRSVFYFHICMDCKEVAEIALFSAVVLWVVFVHGIAFAIISFHSWERKVANLFASLESCFWCEEAGGQTRLFPSTNEPVVISHEGCHIPRGTFEPSYSALHSTCLDKGVENWFLWEEWGQGEQSFKFRVNKTANIKTGRPKGVSYRT